MFTGYRVPVFQDEKVLEICCAAMGMANCMCIFPQLNTTEKKQNKKRRELSPEARCARVQALPHSPASVLRLQ